VIGRELLLNVEVIGKIDICCGDHFGRTPKTNARDARTRAGKLCATKIFVNFALCKLSFSLDIDRVTFS